MANYVVYLTRMARPMLASFVSINLKCYKTENILFILITQLHSAQYITYLPSCYALALRTAYQKCILYYPYRYHLFSLLLRLDGWAEIAGRQNLPPVRCNWCSCAVP